MFVFARRLAITAIEDGVRRPVPQAWLEQFFLRDFTGHSAFDETLPAGDGVLEAGLRVSASEVKDRFEQWLRGRKMIGPAVKLEVTG